MNKIKCGIIGMGYISSFHIDAIRRCGFVEIAAVNDVAHDLAREKANKYFIPKCYKDINEMLEDPEISVIHNCTSNNFHFEINEIIIKSGKHVFSEKPLAVDSRESLTLINLLKNKPNIIAAVNFNYRMNPLVQEIKELIEKGHIGRPILAHGSYLQDWLLYKTDYNWRVEKKLVGDSRAIADIGSHWIDTLQTVLNDKITEVFSDLVVIHKTRYKPKKQEETFVTNENIKYKEKDIDTEDYGSVLFKTRNGMHGVFYVSQVSSGRKCFFNFEINGTESSIYWNQENADQMWIGHRKKNNENVLRNPDFISNKVKKYTFLAAGHPEGWNDAERNNIFSFYKYILDGKKLGKDECDFATFKDAHYIIKVTEAILKSNKNKKWVKVQ